MNERFLHKKSLGQHFLTSDVIPKKMCSAVDLQPEDLVVEIGPGSGVLTEEILNTGAKVIAVETDDRAITTLEEKFADAISQNSLTIVKADARKLDLAGLGVSPGQYKVIANIPYYISGLLFRTFLDSDHQPSDLVFLVQKELAERIVRDPKESLLSLSVKAFGNPQYVTTVKRGHFIPPPKVDSAIVAVRDINLEYFDKFNRALFFRVIKAGFASKRKQLAPNLKSLFPVATTKKALVSMNVSPLIRAEDLSLSQWYALIVKLESTS